jgi:hypothetical protein
MKTKLTLLVAGLLSAFVLSASLANADGQQPLVLTDLGGTVRIQQGVPCGDPVDVTTTIGAGRMDITPAIPREAVGSVLFDLARLDVFLTPFTLSRDCKGIKATAEFSEIGLRLAGSVRFFGAEVGAQGSGQFSFRIPKESFLIYASILDNAAVPQPETQYQRPSEDVTGLIDLRRQTVQLHVVLATALHFRAGCVRDKCRIDEIDLGTQTSEIVGTADGCQTRPSIGIEPLPDTTPPTVTCTAVNAQGNTFRVAAEDGCNRAIAIRLGPYILNNGEVIQLQLTGRPGVRLLDSTGADGIRHFEVGRADAFVTATDLAGNTASANCR